VLESRLAPVLVVGALALALPVVVMPPPAYADAYLVFEAAKIWPHIPPDQPAIHQTMRIGILLPARLFQELLGGGQLAFFTVSTLLGALLGLGTYAVGSALFGRLVGFTATVFLLIHPFFVVVDPFGRATSVSTGQLLPDMPAAGLYALGVAGLAAAARDERRQRVLLVLAGICFGLAYLVREYMALMFIGIPFFLLALRIPMRRIVTVAVPMASIFAIELVHSALVFGHPLARLRTAAEHGLDNIPDPPTTMQVLGRFLEATTTRNVLGAVFIVALAVIAVGWIATRDRRLFLALVWFLALWVPLTLLAGIINPSSPSLRPQMTRYWTAVFPILLIGALGTISLLVDRIASPRPRRWVAGGVVVLLLLGYALPAIREVPRVERDAAWNELRGWLAGRNDVPGFWTDWRTAQTLTFYTRTPLGEPLWNGKVSTFNARQAEVPDVAAAGPILFTPDYGPKNGLSEANGWRMVWQSSDGRTLTLWAR
jgi:hypothetical protein